MLNLTGEYILSVNIYISYTICLVVALYKYKFDVFLKINLYDSSKISLYFFALTTISFLLCTLLSNNLI